VPDGIGPLAEVEAAGDGVAVERGDPLRECRQPLAPRHANLDLWLGHRRGSSGRRGGYARPPGERSRNGQHALTAMLSCLTFRTKENPMSKPKNYERLTTPLVRDGGRHGTLRPATWEEALDRAAAGVRQAVERRGPSSFGLFSCSKSTNEMNFIAQKFARVVVGSNNIDSCNRT
jgi:hypothetical protein